MPHTYISLDLEFTGLDAQHDEIIEIGIVRFQGGQVLETFSSLVNSRRQIPLKIQQLSGITQQEIDRAPAFGTMRGKILSFVKSYPIVGHNVEMDLRFLSRGGLALNNLAIDTFELATILVPEAQRYSLANLCALLGVNLEQNHRALADALATKDLFLALLERASQWDTATLREIIRLSESSNWPMLRVFRDTLAERVNGQDAGILLRRSETMPERQTRTSTEITSPPLVPTETITPLDGAELVSIISPGGLFARSFAGYEYRPQQVEMLEAIVEAMNTPTHLLVEAGTGTGKSLVYLLPAIYYAVQNGRRVLISSNTINLQDQLFNKDIPDLREMLPITFTAALLKGRGNYLCLRRLSRFRRSRQLSVEQARVLAKVVAWLPTTATGDRSELLLINKDSQVWSQIGASSDTCLGALCPYRETRECFFYRARARAERAHLVVVNHALLLSDLVLENRILPEYQYLVIDEAHHLEEQATSHFGFEVGRQQALAFLATISHGGTEAPGGLIAEVPSLFEGQMSESAKQAITDSLEGLRGDVDVAQRSLGELFNVLETFLEAHTGFRANRSAYDQRVRLTNGLRIQPDWDSVEIAWENLSVPLRQLLQELDRLAGLIENCQVDQDGARDELAQEVRSYLLRGTSMWMGMEKILVAPDDTSIFWITVSSRDHEVTLNTVPLHVGPTLEEKLFLEKDCVVLTSATLRTANSFGYIKERLSLEDPMELALGSPFDFKTSVLLYVPKDIPEPNQPYYQKSVEQALVDLCRATRGRALVLFTSNSQLRATYKAIRSPLERDEILLFGQGIDGSRRQILERFRSTPNSVLLGTRSFWEGIDVVGEALSCLVITRLPFGVPTDPILVARAETFDDPFNEYYLPETILRFRQGFGRLIRSHDDFGIVVVLDKRIITKEYGKTILRSLPSCTARQGPLASLPALAGRWLDPSNHR